MGRGHLPAMALLGPAAGAGAHGAARLQPPRGRLLKRGGGRRGRGGGPSSRRGPGGSRQGQGARLRRQQLRPGQARVATEGGNAGERPESAGLGAGRLERMGCEGAPLWEGRAKAFAAASERGPGRLDKRQAGLGVRLHLPRILGRLWPRPHFPRACTHPCFRGLPGSQRGLSARGPGSPAPPA